MKKLLSMLCVLTLILGLAPAALADLATVTALEVVVDENATLYTRMSPEMIPLTVNALMSNGKTKDVTKNTVISGDMSTVGPCEMTATYTRNGATSTAVFTVNVQNSIFVADAIPAEYRGEVEQKGTVEHLEYTTHVYDAQGNTDGEDVTNECYIYLPYGYTPEKDYNILYLMHGGGENAGYWLAQGLYAPGGEKDLGGETFTVELLDNLIAKGYCRELIVVTPCIKTSNKYGFNSVSEFQYEFKNDLVPAVEAKYATYAKGDVSPENLIATRDHRAYDGLSMGSMTGWSSILMGCTDYVGWVGNFSGCKANVPAIAESLNTTYAAYPLNYWYNGNGTGDMAHDEHLDAYHQLLSLTGVRFTEGEDFRAGQNCIFVDKPNKVHSYASWVIDLYNTLRVFFAE